ncbi:MULTISPECIES: hypothetical protein [unclassified Sphingomonas]|jgi:hypothetical protein|uniref:hypothetical protein n=1 Tax=unclassified Sphingomonas TaxID=196159 RepID=UPI000E10CD0F|nr:MULTISPECIES: hypothetical protein [unclassified Sphingomonas]AXJ94883.1 hypothetical protein DM480_04560 [Sphingomonas sp. FARSPH]
MMADAQDPTHEPEGFGDLPIQPTGSGVADLEVAYEQMRLAEGEDAGSAGPTEGETPIPLDDETPGVIESEAHPS